MNMKYLSLFSGIGGFELGIQQAYVDSITRNKNGRSQENKEGNEGQGLLASEGKSLDAEKRQPSEHTRNEPDEGQPTCVGFSEIDKYAVQIYQKHFPNHKNYGDITKIIAEELPDFDCLVGGFPCQSFSIAGLRRGFLDTRGTLFFDIARILKAKRPTLLLLENVKGLLSHDEGKTFSTIVWTLDELGYDIQWQVLNSKNHGVPQNRERVFIVGHLRGTSRPEVFPITGEPKEDNRRVGTEVSYTIDANYSKGTNTITKSRRQIVVEKVIGSVKVRKYAVSIEKLKKVLREHKKFTNKEIAEKLNQPKTLVEHWFRNDNSFAIPDENIWFELKKLLNIETDEFDKSIIKFEIRDNKFDMANRVYQKEGISPTLTTLTGGHQNVAINDGYSIRRLTPTECERLQGFPDGWTEGVSDTQRYKCLGNAVTVNVIQAIMERLIPTHS